MLKKVPQQFLTLAFLVIFAVFAFTRDCRPGYGMEVGEGTKVKITFWHAMRDNKVLVLKKLLEEFEKENQDVKVEAKAVLSSDEKMGNDYNALYQKLLQGIAEKSPPDLAQVYENWTTQFIDINALTSVDSFSKGKNFLTEEDMKDFFPIFLEANTYDGRLWTIPFNKSIYVLYYNKEIFEKHGLTCPKTWKEMGDVAKKLTIIEGEKGALYGLVYTPSVDMFGHWLYAYGGDFLSGDKVIFGDSTGVDDLNYWVQLTNVDRSALPSFNALDDFLEGKGAMFIATTSSIGILKERCKFSYGIASLPEGTIRSFQFAGTNLAIFANSSDEKKEAAWRFIKFLTSTESTTFWAIETGYLPVRKSAVNSSKYKDYLRSHSDFDVGIQSLAYAKMQPRNPAWESIRGFINDAIYEAISQTSSPQDALKKAVDYSNMLIKGFKGEKQ